MVKSYIGIQNIQVSDSLLDCLGCPAYSKPARCHHTLCGGGALLEAAEGKQVWCNSDSKLSVPAGLPGSHLQLASTTGGFQDRHQIVVTSKVEILSKGKSQILSVIAGKWAEQNICKDIARSCEIFRENRKISFHKKTGWKTRDQTDI